MTLGIVVQLKRHLRGVPGLIQSSKDRTQARVGVLQVRAGVTLESDHPVQIEHVVALAVSREVGVLDGGPRDLSSQSVTLVAIHLRRANVEGAGRATASFVEQRNEFDRVSRTSLQHLAVGSQHIAEGHVLTAHRVRQPSGRARHREDHFEVLTLRCSHHVQDLVGVQVPHPVTHRGQVGGRVPEALVTLLHDER